MRMLQGRRICFMGDSLSAQQAVQLQCSLISQGVPVAVAQHTVTYLMARYLLAIPLPSFRASKKSTYGDKNSDKKLFGL